MRVKRGIKARRRRKRIFKLASGFRGRSKNTIRQATQRMEKSLVYRYRDRKARKRLFRRLWNVRISAAAKTHAISYSRFIQGLKKAGIELDRKVLAELGTSHPEVFRQVVDAARAAL